MRFAKKKEGEAGSKYNAKKTILDLLSGEMNKLTAAQVKVFKNNGFDESRFIIIDSELEAKYYRDKLLPLVRSERIKVELQPKFTLLAKFEKDGVKHQSITYSPDFAVLREGRKTVYVDVKGAEDQKFGLKRKMFDSSFPDFPPLVVMKYCKKFGGWITIEEYAVKKRLENKEKKAAK